jgi:hypothetical protein
MRIDSTLRQFAVPALSYVSTRNRRSGTSRLIDPKKTHVTRGWCVHPLLDGHPHRCSTYFEQTLLGRYLTRRVLDVHVSLWVRDLFWCVCLLLQDLVQSCLRGAEACVEPVLQPLGWKEVSGAIPERCEFLDYGESICVLKFDSPLPENHRANILSTADSGYKPCACINCLIGTPSLQYSITGTEQKTNRKKQGLKKVKVI